MAVHGAGQHRSVGQWVQLARRGFPGFSSSKSVGLRVLAEHAGRERQEELKRKNKSFSSSPAARPGEEERGTVSFKTTPFYPSLFSFFFFFT